MLYIAQLIKLRDYISRYEWNPYHYPTQYIKLKKENWNKLYHVFKNQDNVEQSKPADVEAMSTFAKLKSFIIQSNDEEVVEEENQLPKNETDLKQYFLDELLPFQLKWATSTVTEVSFIDPKYQHDKILKFFLQRFPDIYFVMYLPIFNIKQASVDAEVILISPIGIEIITLIETDSKVSYLAGDDRIWSTDTGHNQANIISPLIGLKRTEHIIKSILNTEGITFPIEKVIMSRQNNIVFSSEPYNTRIIGKYQFEEWFNRKRQFQSTLKSGQLKVIEGLLKHCLTTATKRPEWEEHDTMLKTDSEN